MSNFYTGTADQNGVTFGKSIGPLPTDVAVVPLGGPYYIKLTDVLLMVLGVVLALIVGGLGGMALGAVLIGAGLFGIVVGWD